MDHIVLVVALRFDDGFSYPVIILGMTMTSAGEKPRMK